MKITWCQRSGDRQLAEQGGDWQITCWFERKWSRGVVWKGMTSGTEKESTDLSEIACWFVSWRALISNGIQSSKRALASFPAIDLDCAQSLIHYWPSKCVGPTAVFFSVHFFHVKYLFLTSNYLLTLTGYLVGVHMWCAQIIVTSFFSFLNFFPYIYI